MLDRLVFCVRAVENHAGTKSRRIYAARRNQYKRYVQNLGRVESTGLRIEKTSREPENCDNFCHSFFLYT